MPYRTYPGRWVWEAFAQPTSADEVPGKVPYLTTHRRGFSVTNLTRIYLAMFRIPRCVGSTDQTRKARKARKARKSPTRKNPRSQKNRNLGQLLGAHRTIGEGSGWYFVHVRPMAARNVKPSLGIGTNPGAVQAGRAQPSSVHGGTAGDAGWGRSVLHAWFVPQGGN